jgi:hypothetical protein
MAVKPIKPADVESKVISSFPDEVIEGFNELITENYHSGVSSFKEKEVVARIVKKGISSKTLYKNNWLDVEDLYRKSGWIVEYDKPGFNESYDAIFTFSRKK